jgi:mannosylfructose-phosphate synthase
MTDKHKRIAMLSTHGYFDPIPVLGQTDTGGQVIYVLELSKAFSHMGYKVDIYTRWFDVSKKQVDPVPGFQDVRVIRIPAGSWEFVPKEEIYPLLPELSRNIISYMVENDLEYELFHGHYVDAGLITLDVAGYFHKPSFFTAHSLGAWKREQMGGDPEEMDMKFNFRHRISEETRVFNTVNANTVTSILQEEKLREQYGFIKPNVEVIPPGVNIHRFKPLQEGEEPMKTDLPERYIYCLSRIDTNKGHDILLHAFSRVLKEVPDAHLVIGGGSVDPKPREKEVFDMIHGLINLYGMKDHIRFVRHVSEKYMRPYYQNASLFVMPSIFEPFGMTCQEAMACGVPVVASRYGGIRTVLTNNKDGILIDPKDQDEFVRVMVRLLTDEAWRKEIGKAASELARGRFSWEAIARQHLDFYSRYSA